MFAYPDLLGQPYVEGLTDCYSIARSYYARAWDIHLPNFARPTRFWEDPDLDLYDGYSDWGFHQVFDQRWQIGDTLLMPILTSVNSHAVVIVGDNQILHHLPGSLSQLDALRPRWSNRATVVIRHPKVTAALETAQPPRQFQDLVNAAILRNPRIKALVGEIMES
jgi:cell wall-associated NlpC family hydrolase